MKIQKCSTKRTAQGARRPILVLALLCSPAAWAQVVNGGFETGSLAPWTAAYDAGSIYNGATVAHTTVDVAPHSGSYLALGQSPGAFGRISQTISTVAGTSYTVSVWVASDSVQSNPRVPSQASIQFGITNTPVSCAVTPLVMTLCTGTFVASGSSERLDLRFQTVPGNGVVSFDDVSVVPVAQAVPTLSQWALLMLAAAMAALGLGRLRRRG